mmetsp:Transcript_10095/g.16139  ORF Transcript_10095/g.16139 Transcript_10095/m.16139 type:complete len:112 (+) Transcript_10095:945-1280(+)
MARERHTVASWHAEGRMPIRGARVNPAAPQTSTDDVAARIPRRKAIDVPPTLASTSPPSPAETKADNEYKPNSCVPPVSRLGCLCLAACSYGHSAVISGRPRGGVAEDGGA